MTASLWNRLREKALQNPAKTKAICRWTIIVLILLCLFLWLRPWRLTLASSRSGSLSTAFSKQMDGLPVEDMTLLSSADHGSVKAELWEVSTPEGPYYQLAAWATTPFGVWYSPQVISSTQNGAGILSSQEMNEPYAPLTYSPYYFTFCCGLNQYNVRLSSTDISLSAKSRLFR